MSNKKQTAVEWLEKQFVKLESTIGVHGVMYELMEQSKEMEKEQMSRIYEGLLQNVGTSIKQSDLPTFEKYYKEKL